MATVEETKISGRKYRIWDAANEIWKRVSFWTKASDVEFDDGKTAEEKIEEVNDAMDDLSDTVTEEISEIDSSKVTRMTGVSGYQTVDVLGYNPTTRKLGLKVNGADTVIPFSSKSEILTVHTFSGAAQYKGSVPEPSYITIDMKAKTTRWAELTTASFFNVVTQSLYNTGPYAQSPTGRAGIFVSVHAPETSYNPSTGILTCRQAYAGGACYSDDSGIGYFATQNINLGGVVYCVI